MDGLKIAMNPEAARYINRIRNPRKRQYAKEYLVYLAAGECGEPPEHNVSQMAAQGVRLNLLTILGRI